MGCPSLFGHRRGSASYRRDSRLLRRLVVRRTVSVRRSSCCDIGSQGDPPPDRVPPSLMWFVMTFIACLLSRIGSSLLPVKDPELALFAPELVLADMDDDEDVVVAAFVVRVLPRIVGVDRARVLHRLRPLPRLVMASHGVHPCGVAIHVDVVAHVAACKDH